MKQLSSAAQIHFCVKLIKSIRVPISKLWEQFWKILDKTVPRMKILLIVFQWASNHGCKPN